MRPGEIVEARVDLWSTANVFRAGHRVRIEVAGSCFPKFARNSNTGGDIATERAEQYQAATIWVHHDADHPSRILLPLGAGASVVQH
jgi:uncharacterized protein